MAGSLNRVQLIGSLGKDPEIRATQGGSRIANFSLATSERWKDKATGEQKERTEWHRIVIFNPGLVGVVEKYVHKGSKIFIEGQLQTRKWSGQDGIDRYSTEIVLAAFNGQLILLSKNENAQTPSGNQRQQPNQKQEKTAPSGGYDNDLDDEIPF